MNLSFLLCFEVFLMNCGYQFDVFALFVWHFRGVSRSCWANLARALSVPGRSFVFGARNCTAEGYEPVCALLKCAFFSILFHIFMFFCEAVRTWSLFVQRWTGNGRLKF